MPRKLPKYVDAFIDRTGRPRYYVRRRGFPRVPLPGLPWSEEFMRAYAAAMHAAPPPIGVSRSTPGTLGAAIAAFLLSPQYRGLAKGTQDAWRPILNKIRDKGGNLKLPIPAAFIVETLSGRAPHSARTWFKVLRAFCQFCVEAQSLREVERYIREANRRKLAANAARRVLAADAAANGSGSKVPNDPEFGKISGASD